MEFMPLMDADETITSVTSVTALPAGLTLVGVPTFAGTMAQQRIAGGVDSITYKVTFIVVTSKGNTLEGEGNLVVKNI